MVMAASGDVPPVSIARPQTPGYNQVAQWNYVKFSPSPCSPNRSRHSYDSSVLPGLAGVLTSGSRRRVVRH